MLLLRLVFTVAICGCFNSISAQETACGDGIDNDGDGLIDCYDQDCSGINGCEDFFFNPPVPVCGYTPPELEEIELNLVYQTDESQYAIDQRAGVVVGDLDGDGIAELVSRDNNPARIQIFDGATGMLEQSIVTPTTHPFGQIAIADVDENGIGDLFQVETGGILARYEYGNPNAIWRTANGIGDDNNVSTPQIADINQDGIPEVYIGDRIFNAITGERYVDGDASVNVGGYAANNNSDRFPIYYDLFQPGDPKPDGGTFGPEAAGLEYIAGNQVWTVDFDPAGGPDNGTYQLAAEYSGPTNLRDGMTSIADINGDGRMDIAVMDAGDVYAWDPYTNQIIGSSYQVPNTTSGGRINIGDFDGDGDVELGFAGRNIYTVRNYIDNDGDANPNNGTWVTLWQITGLDDGSQRTGSTLFDFDGNGTVEVVYSEEEHLFIYDGATGMELYRIQSRSGTRTEYPIVADVNGDGTAEIVVTSQAVNGPGGSGTGWISVYESSNQPWVPARNVWNQHGYNVTNINNDLTVPQFQQNNLNPALGQRYNNFLVQTSIGGGPDGVVTYPAADAVIMASLDVNGDPDIDFSGCPDEIIVTLIVDNVNGSAPLPANTPISYYDGDPSTGMPNLIQTTTIGTQVDPGQTVTIIRTIPVALIPPGSPIFLSVNDPGFPPADLPFEDSDFPLTGTAECDYTNNLNQIGNVRCGEVCDNGKDDDGDGIIDEPNLVQTQSTGCPGDVLNAITNDSPGGTYSVRTGITPGSNIGTTVDANGVVTLGNNFTGVPVTETIRYDDGICTEEVTVTTVDDVDPAIICPGNATVALDENCTQAIVDYTGSAQSSDNCTATNMIAITQAPAPGSNLNLGANTVTITATDQSGNDATCTFTITAIDPIAPEVTCPADADVAVDGSCQYTIPDLTTSLTVTDNCSAMGDITLAQTPVQGQVRNADGTVVMVTLTATDEAGNTANCTYTLTLADQTPPTITCPPTANQSLSSDANGNCTYQIGDYRGFATITDNCSPGAAITVTQSPAPGSPGAVGPGTQTITLTATDEAGNSADCSFLLTTSDVTSPMITCPQPATVEVDDNCMATVPDLTGLAITSDNCDQGATLTVTQDIAVGTVLTGDGITQSIVLTVDDGNGLTAMCTTTITLDDVTPPTVTCPAVQDLDLDATGCQVTLPDFTSQLTLDDNCTPASGAGGLTVQQMPAAGTIVMGANAVIPVTFNVDDGNGNSASCQFNVTLKDVTDPTITCPPPATLTLDGDCSVVLPDYTGIATVSDDCAMTTISLVQSPAGGTILSFDGDQRMVTITADDGNGNTVSCTFTVVAEDTEMPDIVCPADRNEPVSANCDFEIPDYTGEATVMDNCSSPPLGGGGLTVTQSPTAGTIIPEAQLNIPQTITLTATDAAGNVQTCTFEITPVDEAMPTIVCPPTQTILLDAANCDAMLGDYTSMATVMDNCTDPGTIVVTQDIAPNTVYNGLVPPQIDVVLTAEDESGNTAACTLTVLIRDEVDPTVDCSAAGVTIALDEDCNGVIPDLIPNLVTNDNCSATALTISQSPAAGAQYGGDGTTVDVTFTVMDASGNTVTCTATVTFEDQAPPTPVVCPDNQILTVDDVCAVPFPDYTDGITVLDNCRAEADIIITQSPTVGTMVMDNGNPAIPTVITVTLTADDGNGNTANCTFDVSLNDDVPLNLTCPGGQIEIASADDCTGQYDDYTDLVLAVNECMQPAAGVIYTQSPADMTLIPASQLDVPQMVTITALDLNGNSSMCMFEVTMIDTFPPALVCPATQTDAFDEACVFLLEDYRSLATIDDNCAANNELTITQDPMPGAAFSGPSVDQTVTISAMDPSGNLAQCTFILAVRDTTPPVVTCPEPDTLLTNADCEIMIGDYTGMVVAQDNCTAEQDLIVVQTPPPGTVISGHNTTETVTVSVTDGSGNMEECSFTVTAKDETQPAIACPGDQVVRPDANCDALIPDYRGDAVVTDNCTAPGAITLTQRPAPGTVLNGEGDATQVTILADDGNGNLDSCSFIVTLEDNVPPTISCPADKSVDLDENCSYDLEDLTVQTDVLDNCTAEGMIIITQNIGIGQTFMNDATEIVVTLTADDRNGNTAQCITTITLEDNTDPEITCPEDQTIFLDADCNALVPDYREGSATDNCTDPSAITVTQVLAPGTMLSGDNISKNITLTADDGNGNTADCSFLITLQDNTPPTIICPPDQEVFVDGSCTITLADYTGLATAADNCSPAPAISQNAPAGTVINTLGTETVTLTADDGNGNTTDCSFMVTLSDNTPPTLVCPPLSVIPADASCVVTIADYRDSIMVSDNCATAPPLGAGGQGALTLVQSPDAGAMISGLGAEQIITLTATDPSGNMSQCMITVELADTTRPTIICPNDTTLAVDANCAALIPDYTTLAVVADNCGTPPLGAGGLTVTQSPVAGTSVTPPLGGGALTITLTATDASGNFITCDFDVQLIDSLPPMIVCPADDVISVDGNCLVMLPDYRPNTGPTDNCSDPAAITLTQSPIPGTPLSGDGTTLDVTIIATDESGNIDSCKFMVSLEDSTDPMITCPTDQELTADDDCEVVIPDYTGDASASSSCDQSDITVTQMPAIGTTISGHNATQTITLTATDGSGNFVSCSFDVTLIDRTPPTIPVCQNDTIGTLTAACSYTVPDYWNIGPATAQDNCSETGSPTTTPPSGTGGIIYTQTPPPGTVIAPPLGAGGQTTITLTADDGNGNTVSCDFELTLTDTISPTITCPADTIANPDANCDFTLEDYTSRAVIDDNCTDMNDLVVTQSPPEGTVISGQAFSQDITLTVTDASGNTTACVFNLTLQDTISPTIECPADKVENLTANCSFTVPDYTGEAVIDDNCSATNLAVVGLTVSQDPAAGTVLSTQNEGDSFTVTLTADDGNGNTTSCSFEVVLDDVIPPVINCPADSTIYVDASCMAALPDLVAVTTTTDNCANVNGGSGVTVTQSPLAATVYDSDDTEVLVTLTADDGNGNTSQCVLTVTLQDTISPMITCPPNEVLFTDGDCEVTLPDYRPQAIKTDNCTSPGDIIMTQDIAPSTVFSDEGTTQVITLTADDGNGNTTSCTLEITVDDNVAPTIVCPPNQTQFTDVDCMTAIEDYTSLAMTDDNCTDMAAIMVTQSPAPGTVFTGVQNVVVTLTADDGNGNTTTCDFTFFVRDNIDPQITCPATQEVVADTDCSALIPDYLGLATATDNCSSAPPVGAGGAITLTQTGPTMVTGYDQEVTIFITATDSSGNFATCDFQVALVDDTDPMIVCPPAQTQYLDATCGILLDDYRGLAVGMDNCDDGTSDLTYLQTPAAGLPLSGDGATQTVTIEATDRSGNSTSCDFVVTVQDTISPTIICPMKDTLSVDGACPVALPDYTDNATVADNCTAETTITVTQDPAPGMTFMNDGTIIEVTLTADDGNGNTTSCTFEVELEDQTDPTIVCPARQVLMTDDDCEATIPDYRSLANASSPCGDMSMITLTQDPVGGTVTMMGDSSIQVVTITATDAAVPPNVVSCTFEVILVDDTNPTITVCPPDETVFLDADCSAMIPDFRANLVGEDNCEALIDMEVAQTPVPGTVFGNDDTEIVVTYTLDDTNGNSVSCMATVTLQDTISPMITCPTDQVIFTDGNCEAQLPNYTNATVSDNCTGQAGLTTTQVNPSGTLMSGFNDMETVTLTVDDGNGQTTSCSFTVTLADDDAPAITCPLAQEIDFAADCGFTLPDYRALAMLEDNCAPNLLTVTQSPTPDSIINNLNTTTEVTLTVTDAGGNSTSCSFTTTTVSPTPPPASATVMLAVINPPTGTGTVNLEDAFDNMAVANLSGIDLDAMLDPGFVPFLVTYYLTMADADAETGGISPTNYNPAVSGEAVLVRIEDPATGCFTISQILIDVREPGVSEAENTVHCNKPGTSVKIDGRPVAGGATTVIAQHQWRIISPGTTNITDSNLMQADQQILMVNTADLNSGTIILEYQFFEDYGDGALVPSVPVLLELVLENVGTGTFFWDGN